MATINFYSKEQIDTLMTGMIAPSQAQLDAMNSGITAAKVTTYDGYATGKQNALTETQLNAVNSGITSSKVTTYDGYATGKINALASAPTAAHALISKSGDTNDIEESSVTATELGYVSGVTSAIQTQLNGKQATLSIVLTPASGGDNAYYTMTY